jgi:CRP/FNR family transcriptional regulator, cyclic AMP receptor protein
MIEQALRRSVLADLPPDDLDRVLGSALRVDIPAGSVLYREGDAPRCGVLVSGLARVFLLGADGRQVTVRYMRPGSLSGASLVIRGTPAAVRVQAVTDLVGILLNWQVLRALAHSDARVAWALADEVARSQDEIMHAFATQAFGTLRQRLARHLLDLAAASENFQVGHDLVATVTQQELADAVGSTREAVARVLHDLRCAALVETTRRGVVLLDAVRLDAEAALDAAA